jgi:hypothetical protein
MKATGDHFGRSNAILANGLVERSVQMPAFEFVELILRKGVE